MFLRGLLLSVLMVAAQAHAENNLTEKYTLDEMMSPDQLAAELGLPATETTTLAAPLVGMGQTPQISGVNVFQEFPLVVVVNKNTQRLQVYQNGKMVKDFKTSTGRNKWENPPSGERYFSSTPNGWYAPTRFVEDYDSHTWDAKMQYSIFFNGGIAIHATSVFHYLQLGSNASGGCVRLSKGHAKWLWDLVRSTPQANVPYFNRSGSVVMEGGAVKRHMSSPLLIIVQGSN